MGNEVKYYNVTFNDAQNGAKKTFQIQEGTTIKLTSSAFTVNKDCTIDVTLPQYTAASVWDSNHDGKIDKKDANNCLHLYIIIYYLLNSISFFYSFNIFNYF